MSATNSIRSYSDKTLWGAIKSLSKSGEWRDRLKDLKGELYRRQREGVEIEDPKQYTEK